MKLCLSCGKAFVDDSWSCPCCRYQPVKELECWTFAPAMARPENSFNPVFFKNLSKIEEQHWWFLSRRQLVIWTLRRYFFPFKNFLEVGCGSGFILSGINEAFPALSLSGSDLFLEGLGYASKRLPEAFIFQTDARKIPFEDEFDVIGAFDVLEHIDEDEEVLSEVFKAVKPGGGIILTVPHLPCLWSEWDTYVAHKRRYTKNELIQKVRKAGFEEIWCTSFVSLLLPAMFLVRFRRYRKKTGFNLKKEFEISNWLNNALMKLMTAELFMVRIGISMPVGGSILLVAKKGRRSGQDENSV